MYPVKDYKVTCKFGEKGSIWKCNYHCGVDLIPTKGDYNVYAPIDALVVNVAYSDSYGNYITLKHGDGYTSRYAHLKSIAVKKGQKVKKGDVLAIMGKTGNASGVHLHFEVNSGDMKYPADTNPMEYLEKNINNACEWAESLALFSGNEGMWQKLITRQELAEILYRYDNHLRGAE